MPFQPYFFNDTPTEVEQIIKNSETNKLQDDDIAALRRDVDTTLADLDKNIQQVVADKLNTWSDNGSLRTLITNKKILLVGDSYLYGVGLPPADSATQNYGALLSARGFNITSICTSGGGFNVAGNAGTYNGGTFLTILQQFANSISNDAKDSYTDILFLEGINDSYATTGLSTAIYNTIIYANDTFKNAKCHIGYISQTRREHANILNVQATRQLYKNACLNPTIKCCYIDNADTMLKTQYAISNDGLHPTALGQQLICNYLTSYLIGGNISTYRQETPLNLTLGPYVNTGVFNGTIVQHNNIVRLSVINATAFAASDSMPILTFDGTVSVVIGQLNNLIWGQSDGSNYFSAVQCQVGGTISYYNSPDGGTSLDNTITTVPCCYTLRMTQQTVFLTPQLLNNPAQWTVGKIVQMNLNPFSAVFCADDC